MNISFENKQITITGGTGTLGRAIAKLLWHHYSGVRIRIISRDEIKQLEMREEFARFENSEFLLGDVRDRQRMYELIKHSDLVIHAAALKHVVIAEQNPTEYWKTNVEGTENVREACLVAGVEKAVLISSDKAFDPMGVYGKTKLEAERVWTAGNWNNVVVRLGNIIASRGSVWELFERQRATGVLKVTHPDATRYVISQEEAAQFAVDALLEKSEKLLIPKMASIIILDLAKSICPDCEIEFIGLRPGEKLHEVFLSPPATK